MKDPSPFLSPKYDLDTWHVLIVHSLSDPVVYFCALRMCVPLLFVHEYPYPLIIIIMAYGALISSLFDTCHQERKINMSYRDEGEPEDDDEAYAHGAAAPVIDPEKIKPSVEENKGEIR